MSQTAKVRSEKTPRFAGFSLVAPSGIRTQPVFPLLTGAFRPVPPGAVGNRWGNAPPVPVANAAVLSGGEDGVVVDFGVVDERGTSFTRECVRAMGSGGPGGRVGVAVAVRCSPCPASLHGARAGRPGRPPLAPGCTSPGSRPPALPLLAAPCSRVHPMAGRDAGPGRRGPPVLTPH